MLESSNLNEVTEAKELTKVDTGVLATIAGSKVVRVLN
jgi:hypothetical protein